jgi:hypothetical protein
MRKDENPADLDVCFSDIWTTAHRSRSHFLQRFAANTWRMMWGKTVPNEGGHARPTERDVHEETGT